ncbi:MAG: protein kinase domain-containing protein [Wenzhouxiangella sp.]
MGTPATAADWQAAEAVLDQLLDLEEDERRRAAEQLTQPGTVRACVLAMLAALERPGLLDRAEISLGVEGLPATLPDLSGQVVDRYRLEALVGRGGMSAVYRARRIDGAFDAAVAIKLLNPALLSTRWGEQFQREVRFLAGLRHPNIASLLDAGVMPDGTPWMVTEFIEGQPIDRYCDAGLSLRQRVSLVRDLCRAVAFAQANLIVHRDIKPDNVLVTAEARVVLLDFGIARALDAGADPDRLTHLTRVFTPQYAAPEQLSGEPVTTATDVFAIGALLFRLLTGRTPFDASVHRRTTELSGPPSRELGSNTLLSSSERRQLQLTIRGDLDNVVQKALAPEPSERYANAEQLADDLDAWLAYRSVRARRPSTWGRLRLFYRRRTALASSLSALFLVTLVGLFATFWQASEARNQAQAALAASDRATAVSEFLVSLFEGSDPDLYGNRPPDARTLLDAGLQRVQSELDLDPETRVELMLTMAHIYRKLSEPDQAEKLLELSQAESLGNAQQRARFWIIRSSIHFERGQSGPAIEAARQAGNFLGPEAPLNMRAGRMSAEARALNSAGRLDEALALTKAQLDLLDASGVEALPLRLDILSELIGYLARDGQLELADQFGQEALQLIESGVGRPTTVLSALSSYSIALNAMGRLAEAAALQRRAIEVVEQAYPAGNLRHAVLASGLANRLQSLGKMDEAQHYFELALAAYDALFDEPNLHSASVHNNYGVFLRLMERPAEALPHLRIANAVAAAAFGDDDQRTINTRINLAHIKSLLAMPEAADELQEALAADRRIHGESSFRTASMTTLWAEHLHRHGEPEAALRYSEQALAMLEASPEAPPSSQIGSFLQHARSLAALDQPEAARTAFERSLEIAKAAGADAGHSALRAVDAYTEWLLEHDPAHARSLLEIWLSTEGAEQAQQWPLVQRLQRRLAQL